MQDYDTIFKTGASKRSATPPSS